MDQQQSQFYFREFVNDEDDQPHKMHNISSPIIQPQNKEPLTLKAFNPFQFAQNLPHKQQQKYLNMMLHNKTYPGLTHFINFDKSQEVPEFFNSIKADSYGYKDWTQNPLHLQEFFQNQDPQSIKRKLQDIEHKIGEINKRTFHQININHLIIPSFRDNFDNYFYVSSHLNFLKDFEIKMLNFAETAKKNTQEQLIVQIYQFWLNGFQQFVLGIKKHSERYTLNLFKKLKDHENVSSMEGKSNPEGKSTSSSRIMQTEKRRAWKSSELQLIQKVIESNNSFNQAIINKLAEELNRTPASVSSKIQKILKDHKNHNPDYEVHQNMTLLEKVINVLKNYPNGLSRESVIERVKQHYEMGYDLNWPKSVAQILSSRPQFVRIKGTYALIGNHKFDLSKKTFKDKVVNCLLKIPEGKGDLKRIVDQYISLYGMSEGISILSQQRRKTIQSSISKSLCRYDIFDKQNSKTVYKLAQFCDDKQREMELESYIS